jgi:hypothetical protein
VTKWAHGLTSLVRAESGRAAGSPSAILPEKKTRMVRTLTQALLCRRPPGGIADVAILSQTCCHLVTTCHLVTITKYLLGKIAFS